MTGRSQLSEGQRQSFPAGEQPVQSSKMEMVLHTSGQSDAPGREPQRWDKVMEGFGSRKEFGFYVTYPGKLLEEMTCILKGALWLPSGAWVAKVEAERSTCGAWWSMRSLRPGRGNVHGEMGLGYIWTSSQ